MKIPWIFPVTVVGISLTTAVAIAGDKIGPEDARRLVGRGEILPLSQLLDMHADKLAGQLLDLELEQDKRKHLLYYEIEVLGTDGQVREFEIDAVTGKLLEEEVEK